MWKAAAVDLRPCQKTVLERIAKSRTARSDHRQRARLMLLFEQGFSNRRVGEQVGLTNRTVGCWRKRWLDNQDKLQAIETAKDVTPQGLMNGVKEVLSDLPRSGTRPKFSAEQVAKILTIACEEPEHSGLPLSHWTTLSALRREVIERGVAENISTSRLQVFLKSGRIKAA